MTSQLATTWINQDPLPLTQEEWIFLLQRSDVFSKDAMKMICYVYRQPAHQASATAIAAYLGQEKNQPITQQKVTSINRNAAKAIYAIHCGKIPPANESRGYRYWNVLFNGVPDHPIDHKGHFLWRLRPTLILAMEALRLCQKDA